MADSNYRVLVVMDPISRIRIKKDSTFAMLLEAGRRGHSLFYAELPDLYVTAGEARAAVRPLTVREDPADWFDLGTAEDGPLTDYDLILMRKDPPFDMAYVYATYLLELAEARGVLVVNRPRALRDLNEKYSICHFPELISPTLISAEAARLKDFVKTQGKVVLKPLDGMGGASIFKVQRGDDNLNVILETLLAPGLPIMAQGYLEAISAGDKRILLVNGEAVPYALARIPGDDDFRGNLARGGRGEGVPLDAADRHIAEQVGPVLRQHGVWFAGIDVIGDALTEINVTSPTCIRELDALFDLNIAGTLFAALEAALRQRGRHS